MAENLTDLVAQIRALSPPDQLRLATDLLERKKVEMAKSIIDRVAVELGAALALRAVPARLDPDGTATGKTILTAPVVGHNGPVPWPGSASAHIDTTTGKRTPIR